MSRWSRLVGLFVFVALAAVVAAQSQQAPPSQASSQTPTFKAEVEFVEVDALVTDQQGQFVRDLTKNDFQVFEDGKRQTISTFSLVDIPVERYQRPLFSPRPIERDVQTINLHGIMHPNTNAETYGRVLCGLEPNTIFL